jgi:hypothetical protein
MTRRLAGALIAAASLSLLLSGTASAQQDAPPTQPAVALDANGQPTTPLVDPDKQVEEAQAEQARTNGRYSKAGDPGAKANAPTVKPGGKKPTHEESRHKAENEHAQREKTRAAAGAAPADEHAKTVVSTKKKADGTWAMSIYESPPGTSPEKLAADLKTKGKDAKVIDTGSISALAYQTGPNACNYGYAWTWDNQCPNAWWSNNGFADPKVRINDHAGSSWPTDTAVNAWYWDTPNIDMHYLWNSCPFEAGARCVDVYEGNYGAGFLGETTLHFATCNASGHCYGRINEQNAIVQLNNYYPPQGGPVNAPYSKASVVQHELGHVLGLGHNGWNQDIMWGQTTFQTGTGGENTFLMGQVYSIYRNP